MSDDARQIEQMVMGAFWEACLGEPRLSNTPPYEYAKFLAPLIRSHVVDALDMVRAKESLDDRERRFAEQKQNAIELFDALARDGEYHPKRSPTSGDFIQEMRRRSNEMRRI
jgi:hypothetical protein